MLPAIKTDYQAIKKKYSRVLWKHCHNDQWNRIENTCAHSTDLQQGKRNCNAKKDDLLNKGQWVILYMHI